MMYYKNLDRVPEHRDARSPLMRAAIVIALVVAACSNDRGILVEVNSTDPIVAKIRLFVGTGDPTTANLTIAGPHHLDGAVYYTRDPHDSADVVDLSSGPRVAKFLYETSDDIPLVIAVGYDANNQPVTAGLLNNLVAPTKSNQVNAYEIVLDTSAAISVFGTTGEVHLGLWSRADDTAMNPYTAQCAGVQLGHDMPAYFVVSPEDQDCDGYMNGTDLECTPNYYDGSTAADASRPACLEQIGGPMQNPGYCYVGGKGCTDGVGVDPDSPCAKTNICLPLTVCHDCAGDFKCAANLDAYNHSPMDGPFFACTVPAHDDRLCSTTLRLQRPPTGGYGCRDFQIGNDGFGMRLVNGAMELDARSGKDTSQPTSCDATIDVISGGATGGVVSFSGIANYALENNGGIAIPIEFTVSPVATCPSPVSVATCVLSNDGAAVSAVQPQCAAGWSTPVSAGIEMVGNGGSTLTIDGKTMYYVTSAGTLARTTRSSTTQPWGTGMTIATPNKTDIHAPKLSPDNLHILFVATTTSGGPIVELDEAVIVSGGGLGAITTFNDATMLLAHTIESATYTPDAKTLLVAATFIPYTHLYPVTISDSTITGYGPPLGVSTTDPNVYENAPSLSANGLHLFFDSNRDGNPPGIYVSSRASLHDDFVTAVLVEELVGVSSSGLPFVTYTNDEIYYNGRLLPLVPVTLLRATRGVLP